MRKATKRKIIYKPDPSAMYRVFGNVSEFTEEEQRAINLPVREAFQAFMVGAAEEDDFHTLAATVNIAMVCSEKIDPIVENTCVLGVAAVQRTRDRFDKTGKWGLDGPARVQIDDTISIYEQLTSLLTGGQLKTAMVEVIWRMKAGEVLEAA